MDAGIKGVLEKHGYHHVPAFSSGNHYVHMHKGGRHGVVHDREGNWEHGIGAEFIHTGAGEGHESLDKHLEKIHGSQHSEQETNMSQEFKPTTDRQRALLEDLGRFTTKQKQLATIQFSERDKEYFSTNIKTIIDRLQETVDKPIEYNAEKGVVRFKEGETTQHSEHPGEPFHKGFTPGRYLGHPRDHAGFEKLVKKHGGISSEYIGHFHIPVGKEADFSNEAHGHSYSFNHRHFHMAE